jgi:hypothetical protein
VCFVQNGAISCTVHEKKREGRNGVVLTALWVFFFPWTREAREEKDFSSSVTSISPFKKTPTPFQKDVDQPHLPKRNFPHVGGVVDGRQHTSCPSHVSPLFLPIKTGEEKKKNETGERERRAERRTKGEERGQSRKERKEDEKRKEKEERRERKKKKQHHRSPCPQPPLALSLPTPQLLEAP